MEIVKLVKAGDSEAFSLLVERYHRQLLNFIWRLTGDAGSVEDIGQEVFISVYKSLDRFDPEKGTPFSAWLFISARNRCASELRKRGREFVPFDAAADLASQGDSPEKAAMENEQNEAVIASLDQILEPYKSAIIHSLQGGSLQEIALKNGIAVGTVKSRLSRAREMLKKVLSTNSGGKSDEGF